MAERRVAFSTFTNGGSERVRSHPLARGPTQRRLYTPHHAASARKVGGRGRRLSGSGHLESNDMSEDEKGSPSQHSPTPHPPPAGATPSAPPSTAGTSPAERGASFIAEKMPAWWRPEYQSAAGQAASTVPPAPATMPQASPTMPPAPPTATQTPTAPTHPPTPMGEQSPMTPPPQPPAAVVPPVAAAPPVPQSRQAPPSPEAKTMVLGVLLTAPPVAILTVTAGPDTGFKFRIKPTAITRIGREADNDVVLDDPATSRRHAQIQFRDGKYVLIDLGSANGTLVNDQRVTERALSDGDLIKVGQNVILTSIMGSSAPAVSPREGPAPDQTSKGRP
jgi:FHA domain